MASCLRILSGLVLLGGLAVSVAAAPEGRPSVAALVPTKYQKIGPIKVTCTTGMVADLVRNVGGNRVQVTQLMGAGVDPHLYKASPGDVAQLMRADMVFYSGRHLEGKMTELFAKLAARKPTIPVTHFLKDEQLLKDEDHFDPHLWFDVSLWSQGVGVVEEALSLFDPPHASEYAARAAKHRKELADLHEYAKKELATIPKAQRVLVTAHDAFRYFGKAYDLEVRGIQGISTDSEASVKEINELVQLLTSRKIRAVFVESSVSEKNIKALVEGCKARGHELAIGGELFSDAMGETGTPTGTYVGMVRHNVDTIVKALR